MRHAPAVVNTLRTVGHCGGSEVKNIEILFSFLHRFNLVLSVYVFFCLSNPWVPLIAII